MVSVNESASQGTTIESPLLAGLSLLSNDETIPFTRYVRQVLPLDGYVFWLRTATVLVRGSVHVTGNKRQNEDETLSVNGVVFTTATEVSEFRKVSPDCIWVGESYGLRFSFSRSGPRYVAAGVFHYVGDALYPALTTQLVEVGAQLADRDLVVSNSLPAWLSLVSYNPVWISAQIPNPGITLYPSYLVPLNTEPPYGTVHIPPESTRALGSVPKLGRTTTTQHQLAEDKVRITLYGLTNEGAMNFVSLVNQYSLDTDAIGMMDISVVRDEKRTQAEFGIIAMKKTIDYQVSYLQGTMRSVARQLIHSALATVTASPYA